MFSGDIGQRERGCRKDDGSHPRDLGGRRQPLILRLVSRCDPEAEENESEFRFIPRVPQGAASHYRERPLLTLYTSICYATALCATVDGYARGDVLAGSPQAIFDQYYKNQPTDFLREI